MKKAMLFGFLFLIILPVSGCNRVVYSMGQPQTLTDSLRANHWANEWNNMKDDFEDVNQQMEIYSADGNLLLTITENEGIFRFIRSLEMDKWDYSLKEIPPDAFKLCSRVGYLEQSGEMVLQAVQTVYYDKDGYYQISETPDGGSQNKMTDSAARYLIELAGLELSGTHKFADHDFYIFGGNNETVDAAGDAGHIAPFVGMTDEGMLAASAANMIEIHKDGAVVRSISDNQEVFEFLMALNTSEWASVESIPDSAVEGCSIVRYQLGRREVAGQMMEQSRLVLYADGAGYYMDSLIADNGSGHGDRDNELYPQRFRIPDEVGEMLSA